MAGGGPGRIWYPAIFSRLVLKDDGKSVRPCSDEILDGDGIFSNRDSGKINSAYRIHAVSAKTPQ